MTILLLCGNGKTSSRIAPLLHAANIAFLLTSRSFASKTPYNQVQFDWLTESTWITPFLASPISTIYLVPPPISDLAPPMLKFIDFARQKGVNRFILLSASPIEKGGWAMGKVHKYLDGLGCEFGVLRPSWFMENFSSPEDPHYHSIRAENKIYSATGDGKIPFVSADDIARVGFRALTDEKPHNTDHLVLGPELLTYDEVAGILTSVLGREIVHVKLEEDQLAIRLEGFGMSGKDAAMMAALDTMTKESVGVTVNGVVERVTGMAPVRFGDFAARERQCWC